MADRARDPQHYVSTVAVRDPSHLQPVNRRNPIVLGELVTDKDVQREMKMVRKMKTLGKH